MNYFDNQENDDSTFRDTPDEIEERQEAATVNIRSAKPANSPIAQPQPRKAAPVQEPEEYYEEEVEQDKEEVEQDEEEDYADVLSNARLRLEQGKLYEMLMNHNIFDGLEADERAMKSVSKEIKKFAQERMELMLGMRQTVGTTPANSFPVEAFPFNQLEVEVLKSLAAAATKGASRESDAFVPETQPQARKTLNPLGSRQPVKQAPKPIAKAQPQPQQRKPLQGKAQAPVKRPQVNEAIQRILEEEGVTLEEINLTFPPDYKPLGKSMSDIYDLDPEQVKNRNAELTKRTMKQVPSNTALPMPSQDQINSMVESKVSQESQQMQSNPTFSTIMSLLAKK